MAYVVVKVRALSAVAAHDYSYNCRHLLTTDAVSMHGIPMRKCKACGKLLPKRIKK